MSDTNKHIALSELLLEVQSTIRNAFENRNFWVVAEVSEYKFYPGSNRHYLSFVEKGESSSELKAKVRAIAWTTGDRNIQNFTKLTGQKFQDGIQILAKVKVEFHPSFGFQVIILDVDPSFTLGKLAQQREEILQRLVRDNQDAIKLENGIYRTKNMAIRFPKVIQKIAIIGSPNSEGFIDFDHTIKKNSFGYRFTIDVYQSAVQGEAASKEMRDCLIAIYNSEIKYDVVVIIRGGGAKTDFLAFNQYDLARAIARFPIPIITGIGHQRDESICDLMSKLSVNAPTKAAEHIVSHNRMFEDELISLHKGSIIQVQQLLSSAKSETFDLQTKISNRSSVLVRNQMNRVLQFNNVFIKGPTMVIGHKRNELIELRGMLLSKPMIVVGTKQGELINVIANFKSFTSKYLINKSGYLGHYASVVKLMSPQNILNRGFALIRKDGDLITGGETLGPGDVLEIQMKDTFIKTKIESKQNNGSTE